jgi:hypothetical protein
MANRRVFQRRFEGDEFGMKCGGLQSVDPRTVPGFFPEGCPAPGK